MNKKTKLISSILAFLLIGTSVDSASIIACTQMKNTEGFNIATDLDADYYDELDESEIYDLENCEIEDAYIDFDIDIQPYTSLFSLNSEYGFEGLPSSYDARDYGYVTSVKNQNPYSTCWAFAATANAETSLIKHGQSDLSTDLSEYQLAYFTYNSAYDKFGNLSGDYTTSASPSFNYLSRGGNSWMIMFMGASWRGVVDESLAPYSSANSSSKLSNSMAYDSDSYHMQNAYLARMSDVNTVKQLISDNGSVMAGMYWSDINNKTHIENGVQYVASYCSDERYSTNHAIQIIGWDDNYSKENFIEGKRPTSDGAWLVKNSWGTLGSYIWISYEDKPLSKKTAVTCYYESADNYDYIYQYDGGLNASYMYIPDGASCTNIYKAEGTAKEVIEASSIAFYDSNVSYSLQIYLNPTNSNPTSGTPMLSTPVTGTTTYPGYYTISIPETVTVKKGDTFSVVYTVYSNNGSGNVAVFSSNSYSDSSIKIVEHTESNQSVYLDTYGNIYDMNNNNNPCCFRIKAFTSDCEGMVDLTGLCVQEKNDRIDMGVAFECEAEYTEFQWLYYDLKNKTWNMISDWSRSNWTSWVPKAGEYWIHVNARSSTGDTTSMTRSYSVKKNYQEKYINLNGYCVLPQKNDISVGVAYESNDKNVKFQWLVYNCSTGSWQMLHDWTESNWVSWVPDKGIYWIHVIAKMSDGTTKTYTQSYEVSQNYKTKYVTSKGICMLPGEDCIRAGAAYETNDADVYFQWLVYDLQTKQWILLSDWTKSNWTNWKPTKGVYWLRVNIKTKTGATSNYTVVYEAKKNYGKYIDVNGYCILSNNSKQSVGVGFDTNCSNLKYQWLVYDLEKGQWSTIRNWSTSNWMSWTPPHKGYYWIHVNIKSDEGVTKSYTQSTLYK